MPNVILHSVRMAVSSSNSFLSTSLLKPSFSHFPLKRLVSIPTCLYNSNNNKKKLSTATPACAIATDSSQSHTQTATLSLNDGTQIEKTEKLVLPTNQSSQNLLRIRHTCAHVMAMAVQKLYPDAKVTIGPWIDSGFYYDFDIEPLTDKDLKRIKKEMDRIIARNLPLIREEVSRDEAQRRIMAINEPYKIEILESIKEDPITVYHIGNEWWDLCAGPHVESTGNINRKAVELESVAGAYWRGDEKKPMLQRIYGTAWENEEQLKAYLHFKEEARRRDHRRLGQDLDLFSIQDEAGGGLVFWHPKGAIVRHIIEDSWKKIHIERGYNLLYTPHVAKADLWKISGHLDFYRENMYDQMNIEDELYQLRPMNCPYHILVYKRKLNSYRDFPIRVAELGTVYRYELSGSLHGLFRVRGFTQEDQSQLSVFTVLYKDYNIAEKDDAHIFCLEDQIKDEISGVLDLTEEILLQFGFSKYEVNLSTRPEKAVGGDDIWEKATSALKDALDDKGWSYQLDEGGGAFYGPKIDLKIEDALGRKWQCSTIQVDFNLPQRFDITYVDSNSEKKRPIMIHRAVLGSLERFFGVLIEHYAGDFPLWLSPVQARVLPVTDIQLEYCNEVIKKLKANSIRAEVCHGERLPKLIRNAEKQRIPLMAVVGPKEAETQTVTVRSRFGGELGTMTIDDFVSRIKTATESRTSF
ncbi:threonine--tRNA ligase, chloroplastic/mitochondrial 2 isoform X1 [Quercus suber]|uniref:threonine--tRNA ligase, chloroplastic/mitochondrial 2 isoform X1 n=1 Tax=Quercus suber TaxID=58331 RepID=UPI0032DE51CA